MCVDSWLVKFAWLELTCLYPVKSNHTVLLFWDDPTVYVFGIPDRRVCREERHRLPWATEVKPRRPASWETDGLHFQTFQVLYRIPIGMEIHPFITMYPHTQKYEPATFQWHIKKNPKNKILKSNVLGFSELFCLLRKFWKCNISKVLLAERT